MAMYDHTQKSPLYLCFLAAGLAFLVIPWFLPFPATAILIGEILAAILILLAFMTRNLRVCDEGSYLSIRFGPIGLASKRVAYARITSAEVGRSSIIDGWGIHFWPRRGWTYNIWGFSCVVVHVGTQIIRIGTDDPEGLAAFLKSKLPAQASTASI